MRLKRAVCLAVVGFAATLGLAIPSSSAAAADPWCHDPFTWEDKTKHMETCISVDYSGFTDFVVRGRTRTWINNRWRGFHGCVQATGHAPRDGQIYQSAEQRFGVSADHWREDKWTWTFPASAGIDTSNITVRHRQC